MMKMKLKLLCAGLFAVTGVCAQAQQGVLASQVHDNLPAYRPAVDASVRFPDPSHASRPQGVTVPARNVALIAPGMKKSEIYALLDVPHFHEGLIRVRRWNYILNFYTGQGEQQVSCQYQIHFDGSSRVQATYWREQSCADLFNRLLTPPPAPPVVQAPAPAPVQVVTQERQIVRKYDFTFAFNSSAISPAGMQVIRQAAQEINAGHFTDVVVTGFTDTVGSTAYNDALSARRAAAAADVLRPLVSLPVASRASRDLDVQTGAQVREERNRRVQIQIYGVTTVTR